jgi:Xaa-Pro aminopeptidase
LLLSDLEVDRGRKQATVDEVVGYSEFAAANEKVLGREPAYHEVAALFLKSRRVRRALVPANFPLGLSREIEGAGVRLVTPAKGPFWPARLRKTPKELGQLRRALQITEAGMARAMEVLAAARVKKASGRRLEWGGAPLTSERLRAEIDSAILRESGLPANTIVAGGEQACDPHERGHGPLSAGELIIIDIFPRDAATGFYGDLTRTVVKGRATEAQRKLWDTVQKGQKMAIDGTRAGADGRKLHESVKKFFTDSGYPTGQVDGRWTGFFHGTGHGLGMDLHEEPRFQKTRRFETGQVLTVEPGLYYPGLGGVRIEDVVAVAEGPPRMLSSFEQRLEI